MDETPTWSEVGGWVVVRAAGEVDLASVGPLRQCLIELLRDGRKDIVVDLERVEFMDSTGLNVLVRAYQRTTSVGGRFRVAAPSGIVQRALEVTGLEELLGLHSTLDDALVG